MKKNYDELTKNELLNTLNDNRIKLREMRFNKITSTVNDNTKFRILRRDIARLKTILTEREMGLRKEPVIETDANAVKEN